MYCNIVPGWHAFFFFIKPGCDIGVGLGENQEWPSPRKLGALILQTLKENARDVVFRAESIRGQGTWFTLMFDAARRAAPN